MTREACALYTDEDVDPDVAAQLRVRGFDAVSCHELGQIGIEFSDEWRLEFAATHTRVILTHNGRDFVPLARRWIEAERTHAGIIVADQLHISLPLVRTERHLRQYPRAYHHNLLLALAR